MRVESTYQGQHILGTWSLPRYRQELVLRLDYPDEPDHLWARVEVTELLGRVVTGDPACYPQTHQVFRVSEAGGQGREWTMFAWYSDSPECLVHLIEYDVVNCGAYGPLLGHEINTMAKLGWPQGD